VLSARFAQMGDWRRKSGEKGLKLKEAELCSNVPWLFQVETLRIVRKRRVLESLGRRGRVVST
jgi:hypothetical protein